MNKSVIILFSFLLIIVFVIGIFVSSYELFPYEILKSIKNNLIDTKTLEPIYYEQNIDSLIHINSVSNIQEKKIQLKNFIWKDQYLDNLPNIERNISDERYKNLDNLLEIEKLSVSMEHDVDSIMYLFKAKNSNNELIIYHQGHRGDFINGFEYIQFFLNNNYSVLAVSMPLLGMNSSPIIDHTNFGKIQLQTHNQLELLETTNFTPMKFFFEPVNSGINYLEKNYNFIKIHIVGISGGGWMAAVYPALDDRIDTSISVAGSVPLYLRSQAENFGDYEQHHREFYEIANYLDLYIMTSYGENRKFIQIFNKYDTCCFSGNISDTYENTIHKKLDSLGPGEFQIIHDDTHKEHKISEFSLAKIISIL